MQLFERTLGQWLEHWAEETPDKEYIVYSDRNLRFTWSQLNQRVDDMAKGLIAVGVERGTHVGILGGERARLADIAVCLCQDWCGIRHGEYEL